MRVAVLVRAATNRKIKSSTTQLTVDGIFYVAFVLISEFKNRRVKGTFFHHLVNVLMKHARLLTEHAAKLANDIHVEKHFKTLGKVQVGFLFFYN